MISGVILARNEAANIVDCIATLEPHVSEIILIDMESSDETVELARPLVSRVLSHPLISNFDSARNIAIDVAANEWLWYSDADERIPHRTGEIVRDLIRNRGDSFEALTIPFKSYFCGKWIQHSGWWPGYTAPRVLKRGHFHFAEKLHGGVDVDGRQIRLDPDPELAIEHQSYLDIPHYFEKFNRYTTTEAEQLVRDEQIGDWRQWIRHMMHDLWLSYEANQGVEDGVHGFVLAWFSAQYRFVSRAKAWDRTQQDHSAERTPGIPQSIDELIECIWTSLLEFRAAHPHPPLGIVWRSPVWDMSGYADDARALAKGLAFGERTVVLDEIPWSDRRCVIPAQDAALFRALLMGKRPASSCLTITDCIPTLVEPDPCASLNVLRTTFETDRIPRDWVAHVDRFHEVWVMSEFNRVAFRRSGIPPERIRVIPGVLDTEIFTPNGARRGVPKALDKRFVFLSVFEWQLRKGWDCLLRAYVRAFTMEDGAGLWIKATRIHGQTADVILDRANHVLGELDTSLSQRSDIVFLDETLSATDMAELYRGADAFVLPTRGEGWGRTLMEAMACGVPAIATAGSGNDDFMSRENSLLIDATLVPVPAAGAAEVASYAGHQWLEPDEDQLIAAMRRLTQDRRTCKQLGQRAAADMAAHFGIHRGQEAIEAAVRDLEARFVQETPAPPPENHVRVEIEGELFANHSFSNINELMAERLSSDESLAVSIRRRKNNPSFDAQSCTAHRIRPLVGRTFEGGPDVVIRHAFPPNFDPPETAKWVHIQPWEFGHLPTSWIEPLVNDVDEVWAPTNYVKRVYENSGVPPHKVHVIPWGIEPAVFHDAIPGLHLETDKTFKFVFVGGAIERKGVDTLLDAYTEAFTPTDDVCLVFKDMGSSSFYAESPLRERLCEVRDDPGQPEILYIDGQMTPGQIASLYAACDCLVSPYRGEGFGLPILEAMACGCAAMVPRGGASDDFVSSQTAYMIPAKEVETVHDWPLVGPALHLEIRSQDLKALMLKAHGNRALCAKKGRAAARAAHKRFTWSKSIEMMRDRIMALAEPENRAHARNHLRPPHDGPTVAACLRIRNAESELADCLARITAFVDEIVILDEGSSDRSMEVAREYGARVVQLHESPHTAGDDLAKRVRANWFFWLRPEDRLAESDARDIQGLVQRQPEQVTELLMRTPSSSVGGNHRPLRLVRNSSEA